MNVNHHPDITTLMAFSAGTLEGPYATVGRRRTWPCPKAGAKRLRHINTIGGALAERRSPKTELANGALDRLLARAGR